MKYQPKEGDFVECSSIKEKIELLRLAEAHRYKIFRESLTMDSEHLIWINNKWIGAGINDSHRKRILTPKQFRALITETRYEFEEDDVVTAPFEKLCEIHSLLNENGYETYSSLEGFKLDTWNYLFYNNSIFYGSRVLSGKNIIPTDLFIKLVTCSKQEKQMENLNEKIIIPAHILRKGYNAANLEQKNFIMDNCNPFTGETTKRQLKELYNTLNKGCMWRIELEQEFPFLKEPSSIIIKYGEKVDGHELFGNEYSNTLIQPKINGAYEHKAFFLSNRYYWKIVNDESNQLCLIPTRKS